MGRQRHADTGGVYWMMGGSGSTSWRTFWLSSAPPVIVRVFLGVLFTYMGAMKIADPVGFLKQAYMYGILTEDPAYFLNGIALVLPWLEFLCGVALILGVMIRGAAAQITIMLCIFTPAIFLRALTIHHTEGTPFFEIAFDCGCGTGAVIIWKKLAANIGLLLLAGFALLSRSRQFTLEGLLHACRSRTASWRRGGPALGRVSSTR